MACGMLAHSVVCLESDELNPSQGPMVQRSARKILTLEISVQIWVGPFPFGPACLASFWRSFSDDHCFLCSIAALPLLVASEREHHALTVCVIMDCLHRAQSIDRDRHTSFVRLAKESGDRSELDLNQQPLAP